MKTNTTSKKLRIATVFSGIGAFEQSLNKLGIDYSIAFACDNGEREVDVKKEEVEALFDEKHFSEKEKEQYIEELYNKTGKKNYMRQSYFANYNMNNAKWFEDIRFIDGKPFKNKIDVFVGGSPCQSFSNIGKRAGLNDTRGTLFFEYARLVSEMQPKVFIYENVLGMLNHDGGNTWKVIRDVFDSLGYNIKFDVLNAQDYGIPQKRKRLIVVGFKDHSRAFAFPEKLPLTTTMFDYLEPQVDAKYYLGKKGFEFVTNPKYSNRAQINQEIIRTEKANQQFNWNGDFVFEDLSKVQDNPEIMKRAYVGVYKGKKGVCRQLTHRECMRLMGFPDSYKILVPNVWAYRQAGNSIVVNVLENVMKSVLETGVFHEKD